MRKANDTRKGKTDADEFLDAALAELFTRATAQFGNAVKSYWLYDGDPCPGCGFPVEVTHYKGKDALSLNAFIHRPRGVLIGYILCGRCALQIFEAAERNPGVQIPLHDAIEQALIKAYQRHLASLHA
jgi:hypothetical protein